MAYNNVKVDLEDAIEENQSKYNIIANMSEALEKYAKAVEENKSDQTKAAKVATVDRYEARNKLKTPCPESEKQSETFSLETSGNEFEAKVDLNYNIPVSNQFSILANSSLSEPNVVKNFVF